MLPKKERLSRQEFNRFFSLGRRTHSPAFQVVYSPHRELHVSVVVPKKIAKSAVQRNKIRRRMYDIVRRYRTEVGVVGVFIFLVKPVVLTLSYQNLREEVQKVISNVTKRT